ncbi:MAG: DotU family type IV/VI secretion system protein [Desulfovibrio sp.]|nr:DotU family type IV/VI secretion system protein [Desulfovibrio sp.]
MPNVSTTIVTPAGTPFVKPAFASLCRRFEPLAAFALKAASGQGARTISWDACQTQLDALADAEQAQPAPEGLLPEDMACCRMACYTLVDELLNASPRPSETVPGWAARGLQARRLGTSTGGADFFARLEELLVRAFDESDAVPNDELSMAPHAARAGAPGFPAQARKPLSPAGSALAIPPHTRIQGPGAIASAMAALAQGGGSGPSARSAALACGVFAYCLLLGLRGQYYGEPYDSAMRRLREAAGCLLVGWTGPEDRQLLEVQEEDGLRKGGGPDGGIPPRPGFLGRTLGALGGQGALFIALPFILTGLWYLTCATIVARIPLP